MKFLYWLRKLLGVVLVLIWIVVYLILTINNITSYSTFMMLILLLIVLISMCLYPKAVDYCKCGNKWYKKITFSKTNSSAKYDKKGNTKEIFVHVFKCNCSCNKCKNTKEYEIKADGGYVTTDINGKKESHRIKENIYMQNKNLLNK